MLFTQPWFSPEVARRFERHALPLSPHRVLEIGAYEGKATTWLIERIACERALEIHVVDPWIPVDEHGGTDMTEVEKRCQANILEAVMQAPNHVDMRAHKGFSRDVLPTLPLGAFDLIYVDGSHRAIDVLADAVLSFGLLREGGVMIFDDYSWGGMLPAHKRPREAIDMFLRVFAPCLEVLERSSQVVVIKCAYVEPARETGLTCESAVLGLA